MIRPIVRDVLFLGGRSETATKEDISVGQDLRDTLKANADRCVGMAANMIGVTKRVIAFSDNGRYTVMYNPEIVSKSGLNVKSSLTSPGLILPTGFPYGSSMNWPVKTCSSISSWCVPSRQSLRAFSPASP